MLRKNFDSLFNTFAAAEERFLRAEFLAPVVVGGRVCVRIAGVVCTLRVTPASFEGWGVFRATSHSSAELIGEAGLADRRRYLELFPVVRLILCARDGGDGHASSSRWLGVSAHRGDRRIQINGMIPVRLAEDVQEFDVIRARFDGSGCWFDAIDPTSDPVTADYLRKSLKATVEPNLLNRSGLTPEQKAAYAVNFFEKEEVRRKIETDKTETRLQEALRHAGAELVDFLERKDGYRVTYTIGGRRHTSAVNKNDLTVQVAGICLDGRDRNFDLASLVGVIREGEHAGEIVRVGRENDGMEEGAYWNMHPPVH